jgi:hypothetical protein
MMIIYNTHYYINLLLAINWSWVIAGATLRAFSSSLEKYKSFNFNFLYRSIVLFAVFLCFLSF